MGSTLLTLAEVREHVETGLSDDALDRLISAADAEIISYAGAHDDGEEIVGRINTNGVRGFMPRVAASVSQVEDRTGDSTWVVRSTDTYELTHGGRIIESLKSRFHHEIRATFLPVSTEGQRRLALIQLVKLDTQFNALSSENDATYATASVNYASERSRILSRLGMKSPGGGIVA